jgi:GDPmannose 4,6-dehydratase
MITALITGITGQVGCYLAKSLLKKGYKVHGGKRRSSTNKYWRLDEMGITDDIEFVELDLTEQANIRRAIEAVKPDIIYNLAAQSFVGLSFEQPELTSLVDGLGVLRILESIRQVNSNIKFYQASSSELYGLVQEIPQTEKTRFWPRSPYAVAKLFGHHITINYRESYNIFASNGILFNHESPMRGEDFVTRKISKGIALWKKEQRPIILGNLYAKRDWGHAEDFVEGIQLIMNHSKADDFILSTGEVSTVKDFLEMTLDYLNIKFYWKDGECYQKDKNVPICKVDRKYFRPAEVDILQGDATKAKNELGWTHKHTVHSLMIDMVDADMKRFYKK